ncbi:acyl-CoA dehydrogenase [Sphingobium sp. SCG-1]|uniref:acyl-CoA dehydrogenase n=1 Tax=Sphingobium sp. SCG-1 TaxID=2072936 RepID=UPI0016717F33|nr:acyl-CoA dehydrogenase [Sphingobium sp. SCG-1]
MNSCDGSVSATTSASEEELEAIRVSSRRALDDANCHEMMRNLLDRSGEFDRSLWSTAAELGWLGIGIPEEAGGFGFDISAQCVIAEELGSSLGSIPYAAHCAATAALARSGISSFRELVEAAASGAALLTVMATTVGSPDRLPVAGEGCLTGICKAVPAGAFADHLLVTSCDDQLFSVALNQGAVKRQIIESIDNSRGYAHITLNCAQATLVGGRSAAERLTDELAVLTVFEQVGVAQASLDAARDYALERRAFGQPIGALQAIKHMLADFFVLIQVARGAGLAALEAPPSRFSYAVACARLAAMRAADYCAQESIQLHGGIGGTWEAAPHLYLKRARCMSVDLGNQEAWRHRILSLAQGARAAARAEGGDNSDIAVYRTKARAFLAEHAGNFSGDARKGLTEEEDLALGRRWQALKADHGYAAISMPTEYGGGGGTDMQKIVFSQEEAQYDLPTSYFAITMGMPVPIMIAHANEDQKRELMPKAIRGQELWCQLFSEPAAGSDLAALRLTARREGSNWVLNGQKLWTSWAQYCDWGIIVARHDATLPKHQGLTFFFVNMKAPGVTVRPVRMLAPNHVNEVFFDEVLVPDSQRLGRVGDGFKVAIQTLMIERYSVTDSWGYGPDPLILLGEGNGLFGKNADPDLRDATARVLYEAEALGAINRRAFKAIVEGQEPGPEGSIAKLVLMASRQKFARVAMDAAGPESIERKPGCRTYERFTESWLLVPLSRIAGGTDQILRNTIAERILGLPQDYRPDKGIPFKDIPR